MLMIKTEILALIISICSINNGKQIQGKFQQEAQRKCVRDVLVCMDRKKTGQPKERFVNCVKNGYL